MTGHDELLEQFLVEGRELVERAVEALAILGAQTADREAFDTLFRAVHTLKGAVGLFDLPAWGRLLHLLEGRIEGARDNLTLGAGLAASVSEILDLSDKWLDSLDADSEAPAELAAKAEQIALRLGAAAPVSPAPNSVHAATPAWAIALGQKVGLTGPFVALRYEPTPEAYFQGEDPLAVARGIPGLLKLSIEAPPVEGSGLAYDPFRCALRIEAASAATLDEVRAAMRLATGRVELATAAIVSNTPAPAPQLRSLRVEAERLDDLAMLVDELVIAKNALAHQAAQFAAVAASSGHGRAFFDAQAAVDRLVSGVHASVMRLRLLAIGHLLSRFPRQAREIAARLGKEVELVVSGEQVAVDKSIVEGLFEPLLHLVRNAIDHGIEPPEVRRALGKPSVARISIAARAHGDEVLIEVTDDGRGIDVARVRGAAIARGIIDASAAAALDDAEAAELIFAAGFSTADAVTDLSGRGVGMDAVRAAVTRLGGKVGLDSRPGEGLRVRLSLPAQVVLTKILVVKAGGQRFGVPFELVSETHRVYHDQVSAIRAGRAYVRQDNVIPLVRLSELLGGAPGSDPKAFPVLTVDAAGARVGVQVDELAEPVEAPLRPMNGLLAGYPGLLGTILQGDGQVLLVLDLAELAA